MKTVKKILSDHILLITLSTITLLTGILYTSLTNLLLSLGDQLKISPPEVARVILALLWLILILVSLFLLEKYKHRLKVFFGLYWDKKKNPYCNSCKSPVTFYSEYKGYKSPLFYCTKCEKEIEATDENGKALSLVEIRKRI